MHCPVHHLRDGSRTTSLRLAGLRGPWDTPGASTGRPTSRLENRSIVIPCRAEAAGRLAFPAHPPWPFSASPRARDLRRAPPVCRKGLRGPASVDRRNRSPDHAHPPWPLPPLRSLHPVLADPPRWKPPRLVSRLSWDSSVRLSIDVLSEPGPLALPPPGRVGMPLPTHCRSRGFAPPQRLTVSRKVQEYCILLPIMGFVAFHTACRSCGPGKPAAAHIAIPATRFVPLEESPRQQPHRVTAAVAFLRFHRPPGQPDVPADSMGSGRPIAQPTSTHHLGPPRRPKSSRAPQASIGPPIRPRSLPHPCE